MLKSAAILLILFTSLLFSQNNLELIQEENQAGYFEGKNGIELNLGIYDNSSVTSTSVVTLINTNEITNATGGFSGSISYQYWFKNYLAFRIGVGALVTNVDNKTYTNIDPYSYTGHVTNKVATVTSIQTGLKFYPMQLTNEKRFLPYISLYVGPYIGIYNKNEVLNNSVIEETTVETVVGGRTGAGFDVLIGSIFKLGIDFGYNFMNDFNTKIGSEINYSGPDYAMTFGFIF
jgi:hypothetical protein